MSDFSWLVSRPRTWMAKLACLAFFIGGIVVSLYLNR